MKSQWLSVQLFTVVLLSTSISLGCSANITTVAASNLDNQGPFMCIIDAPSCRASTRREGNGWDMMLRSLFLGHSPGGVTASLACSECVGNELVGDKVVVGWLVGGL